MLYVDDMRCPIQVMRRAKLLAFAMGLHPRLGFQVLQPCDCLRVNRMTL